MSAVMAGLRQWNADLTDEQRERLIADAKAAKDDAEA